MTRPAQPSTTGDLVRAVLPPDTSVVGWDELAAAGLTEADAIAALWPGERAAAETFAPKRLTEFATVRACARRALEIEGFAPVAIGRGSRGVPLFPARTVGALTHTDGLRAAVIARSARFRGVGVDAEPHAPLPEGVLDAVSLPAERDWVRAVLGDAPSLRVDKVLFSAKEATYKAWYPLTRRWLGFADAHITFEVHDVDPAAEGGAGGTFVSRILIDPTASDGGTPLTEFRGRWRATPDFVTAAIALPAADGVAAARPPFLHDRDTSSKTEEDT